MSDQGEIRLGSYKGAVEARLAQWQGEGFGERLWQKDYRLWSPQPIAELTDRLGWLELPDTMTAEVPRLTRLGREVADEGIKHAVVLGMGGSSLAPEVYARTFGAAFGYPELEVLDSTHPAAIRALRGRIDPAKSLFVVSSKSGTTTEMLSYFHYFWAELEGTADRGRHFVAVTDPGTPLEKLARERGFRGVFSAPSEVGGRYSALTPFGLVPAALLGVEVEHLLARAREMADACAPRESADTNPGLRLGAAMGELARAGRDKVTFVTSHSLASFPDWIEQLIAESTGKTILAGGERRGIVPVAGEPLGGPEAYGDDRFFAALLLDGDEVEEIEDALSALEKAGHPVARFHLADRYDLGAEMFRWEVATAAAGAVIGVNPFDQPDVQLAKELSAKMMKAAESGTLPPSEGEVRVDGEDRVAPCPEQLGAGGAAGGLPRRPRLPRAPAADHRGAARPPGEAPRDHQAGGDARLRAALPAFDRPAPQGGLRPLPLPPDRRRAGGGRGGAGDQLHLRHLDPRPGRGGPPGARAARPQGAPPPARARRRRGAEEGARSFGGTTDDHGLTRTNRDGDGVAAKFPLPCP